MPFSWHEQDDTIFGHVVNDNVVACDLFTDHSGELVHAPAFDHSAWCTWHDAINQYLYFPVNPYGANPKSYGEWMAYLLDTAQIIEQLPVDNEGALTAASLGNRTGSNEDGFIIDGMNDDGMNIDISHPMPSMAWPSPPLIRSARETMNETRLIAIGDAIFNVAAMEADDDDGCDWIRNWPEAEFHKCP